MYCSLSVQGKFQQSNRASDMSRTEEPHVQLGNSGESDFSLRGWLCSQREPAHGHVLTVVML